MSNVIAFIGSSKLRDIILKIAAYYEKQGNVCIMSHIFSHADGYELNERELIHAVSNGHKRIDMANQVILVKLDDHIGESSQEEKEYALDNHKQYEEITIITKEKPSEDNDGRWQYELFITRYVQDEHDESYDIHMREDKELKEWIDAEVQCDLTFIDIRRDK